MAFQTPITVTTALERIRKHVLVLPAIQREFVWGTDKVSVLFDSLMRGYPIGSFLFWRVAPERRPNFKYYKFIRDYHQLNAPYCRPLDLPEGQPITAILDGQQRLTALNIGLRGSHADKLPRTHWNNPEAYPTKHLYMDLLVDPQGGELSPIDRGKGMSGILLDRHLTVGATLPQRSAGRLGLGSSAGP